MIGTGVSCLWGSRLNCGDDSPFPLVLDRDVGAYVRPSIHVYVHGFSPSWLNYVHWSWEIFLRVWVWLVSQWWKLLPISMEGWVLV